MALITSQQIMEREMNTVKSTVIISRHTANKNKLESVKLLEFSVGNKILLVIKSNWVSSHCQVLTTYVLSAIDICQSTCGLISVK